MSDKVDKAYSKVSAKNISILFEFLEWAYLELVLLYANIAKCPSTRFTSTNTILNLSLVLSHFLLQPDVNGEFH